MAEKKINAGMPAREKKRVQSTVECEGFGYTFISYSNFDNVKDQRFHELRTAFVKAAKDLAAYIDVEL